MDGMMGRWVDRWMNGHTDRCSELYIIDIYDLNYIYLICRLININIFVFSKIIIQTYLFDQTIEMPKKVSIVTEK